MESKLTLKLNTHAIKRAKMFIRERRGKSLSKLVEHYFDSLTGNQNIKRRQLPPIVSLLAGVGKKARASDPKNDYADYLIKKYQ
jgi:hypothetical protein